MKKRKRNKIDNTNKQQKKKWIMKCFIIRIKINDSFFKDDKFDY